MINMIRFPTSVTSLLSRLLMRIIPVLPILRRIVLVMLKEFTGYEPQSATKPGTQGQNDASGFQQAAPTVDANKQQIQQLLEQNQLLVQALQKSRVRQRITLWISITALLISCIIWFSHAQ